MKKRTLSLLLVFVMVFSMIPVFASAETTAATPSIEKVNMTLNGILDVNFKVNANGNDMTGYSVRVTVGSDETSQTITGYTMDGGLYMFTAKLPAHRLPEAMKVELLNAEGTAVQTKENWTVASYLTAVKAANADMTALVDALQNYGTYAAYYADPTGTAPAVSVVDAVENSVMEGSQMELVKTANLGATAALYIDDACDIRVKFDATKMGENKLLVNGNEVTLTADGTKLVYAIEEILPQDWSMMYNFEVIDAEGATVMEFNYSVLSYAYVALGKSTEVQTGLNGLLKSMYLYHAATAGVSQLDDVCIIDWNATDAAKEILTVEKDENLRQITYTYGEYTGTDPYGLCTETIFPASANGNFAKKWEMSGVITKGEISPTMYLSFGVTSASGKSQYFGLFENTVALQNNGDPNETKQPHDGTIISYNQATTSFYWKEASHNADRLEYLLTIENDVLTAYFGNSTCPNGCCAMQKAWQIPLTDATYGGFAANSAYQLSIYAVHPVSYTISDIQVATEQRGFSLDALSIRDTYVLEDNGTYYIYATGWDGHFTVWITTDFELVNELGTCFSAETGATYRPTAPSVFWAPEVFKYTNPDTNETAYYMFATLEDASEVKRTAVLKASSPAGPFAEFSSYDHGFLTPANDECLDGTLYIEDGTPYLIYCNEYSSSKSGTMEYVQLSNDLSHAVSDPVEMFKASDLTQYSWQESGVLGIQTTKYPQVTDGPQVFEKNGQKFLLWSTYTDGKDMETASAKYLQLYIPFTSLADFANLTAADSKALYENDGGHGMIFSMDGKDMMVINAPNRDPHPTLFDVTVNGTDLSLTAIEIWDWYSSGTAAQRAENYAASGNDEATTLFIGDSFFDPSFWTSFYTDMLGKDALIAGIGGSTTEDWYNYLSREIFLSDIAPKNVVVNLGNNDIFNDALTGEQYLKNSERFYNMLHEEMPNAKLYAFSIVSRSGSSADATARMAAANTALAAWCEGKDWITFVDLSSYTVTLKGDGIHPIAESYVNVYIPALAAVGCTYEEAAEVWTVYGDIDGSAWGTDFAMVKQEDGSWLSEQAYLFTPGSQIKCRNGKVEIGNGVDENGNAKNYIITARGIYKIRLNIETSTISLVESWTAIGDIDGSCWDQDFPMAQQEDGTWMTTEALELPVNANIKCRNWYNYNDCVGNGGMSPDGTEPANFIVSKAGTYYICLDSSTDTITLIEVIPDSWTVIGDIKGTAWGQDFPMTEQADGTWRSNVAYALPANANFKCRNHASYDDFVGGVDTENYIVASAGVYYIILNPETRVISLETVHNECWTAFGDINGTGWGTDFSMSYQADGTWLSDAAYTFAAGHQFKCRNGNDEIGDGVNENGQPNNYIVELPGTYYIKLDTTTRTITLIEQNPDSWTVIGDIKGTAWGQDFPMSKQADGTWRSDEAYQLPANSYFKCRNHGSYDDSVGDGVDANGNPIDYKITSAGVYYIILNPITRAITVETVSVGHWTAFGDIKSTGWGTDFPMTYQADGTWRSNEYFAFKANHQFKCRNNGVEIGNGVGVNYVVETSGVYYIILNPATATITLEQVDDQCWTAFGDINGTGWGTDFYMEYQADGTWISKDSYVFEAGHQFKCRHDGTEIGDGIGVNYVVQEAGRYYIKLDPDAATITLIKVWTAFGDINGTGWGTDFPMTQQADGTWLSNEAFYFSAGNQFKCRSGSQEIGAYDASGNLQNYMIMQSGTYYIKLDVEAKTITLISA